MDVLSDEQYEILAFVAICNNRNYLPTEQEVTLWRENPHPRAATYRRRPVATPPAIAGALAQLATVDVTSALKPALATLSESLAATAKNWGPYLEWASGGVPELDNPAETTISHLVRLTWLEHVSRPGHDQGGLRLTDLGQALCSDAELSSASEEDVSVVVLGKADPLAYPTLIGKLAQVGKGLLVDPYLKLNGLHHLMISTQLTRILISDKGKQQAAEVAAMRTHLLSPLIPRAVEVRTAQGLHDRVVVANTGQVHTLGSSLNGVGGKMTVFSPMPKSAAKVLAAEYEELWASAAVVGRVLQKPGTTDGADDAAG